jgi:beta-lactamase regulating signal transducer with metallopeptidase domain
MRELVAAYLLNAAWQAPVVALCALLAARFAGLAPAARHRMWLLFLAAAVVLPAVSLQAMLPHATPTVTRIAPTAFAAPARPAPAPSMMPATWPGLALSPLAVWAMLGLSGLAAAAILARLGRALLAARRLVRAAWPAELPASVARTVARACAMRRRKVPQILRSPHVTSPAVVGVFRPAILIPETLTCEPEALAAALLHETAHVLRHDYAINLACELLSLPVGWHPATLALKAGVRRSREVACDAMAAAAVGSGPAYAKRLVALARGLSETSLRAPGGATETALAVGLFGARSDLEDRLMHLMRPREREAPALAAARLSGLAALGAGLLGSAALLHVTPVFAQAVTPAPAPAPVTASPLPPPASSAAGQADRDAAKPMPEARRRPRMIATHNGVIVLGDDRSHPHSWTAKNGRTMTVYTDSAVAPTAGDERRWEDEAQRAEARAAEIEKKVNSPEFQARINKAAQDAARAADIEGYVNSAEFKARIAAAQAEGERAAAMVNSPQFKGRLAAAQARAAEAQRMVESPEFKARIARAQHAAEEAAQRLQKDLEDIDAHDGAAKTP